MIDIGISENGDFLLERNDIKKITKDELRFQQAMCCVKSVVGDWYSDSKLGANLEEIVGQPAIVATAKLGVAKISSSISDNYVYQSNEIYIEHTIERNTIEYRVYLRNIDKLTSKILYVTLDLVKGVNVRIGRD